MRVLLQPRGSEASGGARHYASTVMAGVNLDDYADLLTTAEYAELTTIFGESPARFWGSTSTDQTGNFKARALRERAVGDEVVFYADKSFIGTARIAAVLHKPTLAKRLWGEDEDGKTWENVIALSHCERLDPQVPAEAPLSAAGIGFPLRSITLLDPAQSASFTAALGLDPDAQGVTAAAATRSYRELTDPEAVVAVLDHIDALGRDRFLSRYGFEPSRDYFIQRDGNLYDSKPVLSLAFGHQFPDHGPLDVQQFSGGANAAAKHLTGLGFATGTRAALMPPALSSEFSSRTDIYNAYGGDKVAGIIRLPGEDIVNIFSDADGPYDDDDPSLTETFGYRGEGRNGDQSLTQGGNAYLEQARLSGTAARFWHRPSGGSFTFLAWTAVLGRAWVIGIGDDGQPRREIEWHLQAVPGRDSNQWSETIKETLVEASAGVGGMDAPEAKATVSYNELLTRVEAIGQTTRPTGVVRTNYARSAAARRAVLLRCGGACESPYCTGMPSEPNRRGEPILDVDHITDLAKGGLDHPTNMIALCPNCHAVKTRGNGAAKRRKLLLAIADSAHAACSTG